MRLAALESLLQFQSPIRRGRRCNEEVEDYLRLMRGFQSPICRGRRCNELAEAGVKEIGWKFQSPICRGRRCNVRPTHCISTGWMFQSPICRGRRCNALMTSPQISSICVSVPYLSGQALQWNELTDAGKALLFQSPICRGRRCNLRRCVSFSSCLCRFSPLLVGAGVAIGGARADVQVHGRVSVPY